MNILLSNDDGIKSKSLLSLCKALHKEHNVTIIAPKNNMSTVAHAVNFHKKIKIKKIKYPFADSAYKISGTPCDCVKIANLYLDKKFDLVVSGINFGHNLSSDILYSGTVSIAIESAFFNVPAIAFSAFSHDNDYDFDYYSNYALKIIDLLKNNLSKDSVFNVNFPDKNKKIKGIKFTKLGKIVYEDKAIKLSKNKIMITGNELDELKDFNSDYYFVKDGYITITPLLYDKTDYETLENLEKIL